MFRKMEKKRKRGEKRRKERHDANGYGKVAQKGEVGRERERERRAARHLAQMSELGAGWSEVRLVLKEVRRWWEELSYL